ncbi:sensor histidine kinase [Zobellia laminariae]|uniref:sensor histidine kinase n=1 Tax=Zobellia laminariae TaxID=248906 RepID=UPI0026F40C76|nr:HAMP domain-containing sensor histidine kinase [Zobellia laminariae]WKX75041.1 HAMP domain-containing sensor histidine kinase [Zobellia laminariae]
MHSLLKRQLKKNLPAHLSEDPEMQKFLAAVEMSYQNHDEKLNMLQRATAISSEELFVANKELTKEAERQKKILVSLELAMDSLSSNLGTDKQFEGDASKVFDVEKLAMHISYLAAEVKEITEEKNLLLEDLEAQNESLNNYVQMVSHDLKSPIRNVNALLSWVLEDNKNCLTEENKENLALASSNLAKMDNLINGILEHATIGTSMESKMNVDVNILLKEIESYVPLPDNVSLSYGSNFPVIHIEKHLIEQIFTYLITNAITATKDKVKGKVEIKYEKNDKFWKFTVIDNGKGIPVNHQSSIFEMFRKLENNDSAAGVGLALAKKIVKLYDGSIELVSEENMGANFTFTLKK